MLGGLFWPAGHFPRKGEIGSHGDFANHQR